MEYIPEKTNVNIREKIFEGTPEGMRQDQTVIDTYFGGAV